VLSQTYPNIEIIVIDDGSKDNTESVLKPYTDRIRYVRNRNSGLAATRNAGMKLAKGSFVAWIDSDDLWTPDKIANQVDYMLRNPDVIMTATDFSSFNGSGILERSHIRSYYSIINNTRDGLSGLFPQKETWTPPASRDGTPRPTAAINIYSGNIYKSLVLGNCLHPPTVVIRKDATEKAGWLDVDIRNMADYDYFLRLSRFGRIAYIDYPFTLYRYSDDLAAEQMSSDARMGEIKLDVLRIIRKVADSDHGFVDANRSLYMRRLADCHLGVADALAEKHMILPIRHILHALSGGGPDRRMIRIIAKALLPATVLAAYRKHKKQ
jgi:glycosyltransferase involved in cell wall biosynthesis